MPKVQYKSFDFKPATLLTIQRVNQIVRELRARGYNLTLRQLFYQFVSRNWIANKQREYKNLGNVIDNGRLAGMIDWHAIVDRTRELDGNSHWEDAQEILSISASQFKLDKWANQENRVEVWVEKDALEDVVGQAAKRNDVDFFSCRGYTSQTAMWDAGQRLAEYAAVGQHPIILHLGDHDPSGIDMSRDIEERLRLYMGDNGEELEVIRIALTMEQVDEYNPPPNPLKVNDAGELTDSRAANYRSTYGSESWELDALDPEVMDNLIESYIQRFRDDDRWNAKCQAEDEMKRQLTGCSSHWPQIVKFMERKGYVPNAQNPQEGNGDAESNTTD